MRPRSALPLLLVAACGAPFPCAEDELLRADGLCVPRGGGGGGDDTQPPNDDTADTGEPPIVWTTLPASCEVPTSLPADTLVQTGQDKRGQDKPGQGFFVELIDLELHGDRVYGVGQGGLMVYDVADPTAPALLGVNPSAGNGRYHRVEVIQDGLVAVTHRDRGLELVDVSDPTAMKTLGVISRAGIEGLAWDGDRLWLTDRARGLVPIDVSDPTRPVEGAATPGLSAPWELSPILNNWSYVSDNALGVVPIDLNNPDAPVIHPAVALPGATQHVTVADGHLYAAIGGAGVAVLSLTNPAAPSIVRIVPTGGSAAQVSAADGLLWVADHEGIVVYDLSDPANPRPLAREQTEQFALAVRAAPGDRAWVGDWNILSGWALDRDGAAPSLDPSTDSPRLPAEGGETSVRLTNRGDDTLTLSGATVGDARVTVEVSATAIQPGEEALLRLTWSGGETLDTSLCLSSNDPDEPTLTLKLTAGVVGDYLGQAAPDFALTDLNGDTHRLSEQLGAPVLLAYFATW
ncbi:MAG: hypothetical protein IPI35_18055 [Deltaproteobacteria bacterium]|nr:hypothetical protein [Deltaproteobacteria bacterium]